jgi:nicotinamidase-related amidase
MMLARSACIRIGRRSKIGLTPAEQPIQGRCDSLATSALALAPRPGRLRLLVVLEDPHTAPDFAAAALITIDTQRDVLDGGPLEIAGTSAVLPRMRTLALVCRELGRPIVHVVRVYRPDGSNADLCRRRVLQDGAPVLHPGAPGTQIAEELLPAPGVLLDDELLLAGRVQALGPGEVAVYKSRWGAFYRTPLEQHLRERGVSTLVFSGCNFPNCPRASIYEASERDFRVVLVRDAVSGLYERGERELAAIGVRLMSAQGVADELRAAARLLADAASVG